jgi:hypothetical protein
MLDRSCLSALLLVGLVLPIAGCGKSQVDSLAVTPGTQSVAVGQTANFSAIGTYNHGSHPSTTEDVTADSSWVSSAPDVATVESPGVILAKSSGTATITASIQGYTGILSSSALLTVTGAGGAGADIVSVNVIPGTQSVATPNQTTQFLAIGTTSAGTTVNLNGTAAWYSSDAQVASINGSTGLAQGASQGTTTITAIANNADNTVAAGEATLTVLNGAAETITSLTITPLTETMSAEGETSQLLAIGTSGTTGLQLDLTNMTTPNPTTGYLTWASTIPSIATVCNNDLPVTNPVTCTATTNGLVTGQSVGETSITAVWTNPDNTVVSAVPPASITTTSTPAPEPLLSLAVIPNTITVDNLQGTGNFLAIGTFSSSPYVRDLTNTVTWLSSFPNFFPVSSDNGVVNPGAPGGIVTAYGIGSATIIAEATNTDGSVQTQTATFSCPLVEPCPCYPSEGCSPAITSCPNGNVLGSCFPGSEASALLSTVTVYNEGLNTTNWEVTAPSATGTPDVIHCGPGFPIPPTGTGSVCVATYPIGTQITLTAPAQTGVAFGGWSSNCAPNPNPPTATGPNQCVLTPTQFNETVGAIFNNSN